LRGISGEKEKATKRKMSKKEEKRKINSDDNVEADVVGVTVSLDDLLLIYANVLGPMGDHAKAGKEAEIELRGITGKLSVALLLSSLAKY
jgi:hypothetical protein